MAQEETKMTQQHYAQNSEQDELHAPKKPRQDSNDKVWAQVDHRQQGEPSQPANNRLEGPFRDAKAPPSDGFDSNSPYSIAAIEEKPQGSPQT